MSPHDQIGASATDRPHGYAQQPPAGAATTTAPGQVAASGSSDDRQHLVIAIDGPSGSGKSTLARSVARALGLRYLDTGATYRAATWWVLHRGVALDAAAAIVRAVSEVDLEISTDPDRPGIWLRPPAAGHDAIGASGRTTNGGGPSPVDADGGAVMLDLSAAIRTQAVTAAVSAVSAVPAVRTTIVALQRRIVGQGGFVVEGRDIGTVVCPDAAVKIFLTASDDARATRRFTETASSQRSLDADTRSDHLQHNDAHGEGVARTREDLRRRDRLDSTRAASPLARAADAVLVDSTALDAAGAAARVLEIVRGATGVTPRTTDAASDLGTVRAAATR